MSDYQFGRTRLSWRQTFRQPKMGPLDYRLVFFLIIFLFYIRLWTFMLLLCVLLVFFILQQRRIEPDNVLRWVRATIAGRERTAHGVGRLRPAVDYGFETENMVKEEERRQRKMREAQQSPKYKGKRLPKIDLGPSRIKPLKERLKVARAS